MDPTSRIIVIIVPSHTLPRHNKTDKIRRGIPCKQLWISFSRGLWPATINTLSSLSFSALLLTEPRTPACVLRLQASGTSLFRPADRPLSRRSRLVKPNWKVLNRAVQIDASEKPAGRRGRLSFRRLGAGRRQRSARATLCGGAAAAWRSSERGSQRLMSTAWLAIWVALRVPVSRYRLSLSRRRAAEERRRRLRARRGCSRSAPPAGCPAGRHQWAVSRRGRGREIGFAGIRPGGGEMRRARQRRAGDHRIARPGDRPASRVRASVGQVIDSIAWRLCVP